jgi:5-methylcytosine-specific restriction protein A
MGTVALNNANFQCELDNDHETFKWKNAHGFVEKHHLIPMKHYLDYKLDIDHPYNIYCLCPNCRKMIQFGAKKEKRRIVDHLYSQRKDIFLSIYISSIEKMRRYYLS